MTLGFKSWALASAAIVSVTGFAHAQEAEHSYNIPAQSLRSALTEFGRQSGRDILFSSDIVQGRQSSGVVGAYSHDRALEILLQGSQLTVRANADGTYLLRDPSSPTRLGAASDAASSEEEIIVTAQKREERLLDVPVPVSAVSAEGLLAASQVSLQDYYARIPALNLSTGNRGEPQLAIRGVTSGYTGNPVVGIVIDDIPFGATTGNGGGFMALDLDPSDLTRIEVLRGPQGTLYGASSMGGLFKYVTVAPNFSDIGARVQAGVSTTENGDGVSYVARASANAPFGDQFAMRGSAFFRDDAGYIDNDLSGENGVNGRNAGGFFLSAAWAPNENLSVRLGALLQYAEREGAAEITRLPGVDDLHQVTAPRTGTHESDIGLYYAVVEANLGGLDFTSLTSFQLSNWSAVSDFSPIYGFLPGALSLPGDGLTAVEDNQTEKVTQEFRVASQDNSRFNWLLGLFYTKEDTDWTQEYRAIDATTGDDLAFVGHNTFGPTSYEEVAAFANVGLQLSDRFDIQVGARQSHNEQSHEETGVGPLFGGLKLVGPVETEADAFTYSVTPRFRFSEDVMVYARFASGYRAGGPNQGLALGDFPLDFDPDTTLNYEAGLKGAFFKGRLVLDASVYHIDWSDIQLSLTDPGTGYQYFDNASEASIDGVEISVTLTPSEDTSIAAWVAYNDATLGADLPATSSNVGNAGDRLPFSSEWSANLSLDHAFHLSPDTDLTLGASASYVGERIGDFRPAPERQVFPDYTTVNAFARFETADWNVNFFVNNITDERALLSGGLGSHDTNSFTIVPPRTAGVSVAREF